MFLAEPPRTHYDLNFTLLGVPVRVHPLFWLVGIVLGFEAVKERPAWLVVWLAVIFVSILVHEMGHALTMRYYGWNPSVTLYAMGGFARYDGGFTADFSSYQRKGNREFAQLIISAAGPAAGFLLAALTVLVARLLGSDVQFSVGLRTLVTWQITQLDDYNLRFLMNCFLWVNIYWGLLNLLPVYPLDGGQISRELFMRYSDRDGIQRSLWLSIGTGAGLAAYGLYRGEFYIGLLFAYLAFSSYQLLQSYTGGGFGGFGGRNPW